MDKKVFVKYHSKVKKINVCVIGVGTTGSYIIHDIKNLGCIAKLVLVDPDSVELSNIYRQDYTKVDLGKKKVDVLKERGGRCDIIGLDKLCASKDDIVQVCYKYNIDLLIQAGDYPSTRELAKMTEEAANELNIPYITNNGYISNVVSLPEFYYPNEKYDFLYKHKTYNENLVFMNVKSKAQSRIVANVGHVIARQIIDYCTNERPFKYKERGFFDIESLKWRTDKFE